MSTEHKLCKHGKYAIASNKRRSSKIVLNAWFYKMTDNWWLNIVILENKEKGLQRDWNEWNRVLTTPEQILGFNNQGNYNIEVKISTTVSFA